MDQIKVEKIEVENLLLDSMNPRLASSDSGPTPTPISLTRTLYSEMSLQEIADSIAQNGYFEHEYLYVIPAELEKQGPKGKFVVVEGNRRLATVKILLDDKLRTLLKATDLPRLSTKQKAALKELPVIKCIDRKSLWQFLGNRHINGVKPWDAFGKAKYIAYVHENLKVPLDDVAVKIGDRHNTVKRFYRGYCVLRQAEKFGFDKDDRVRNRFYFSHLYTALDYPEFQKYIGINDALLNQGSLVPKSKKKQLLELMGWLYGSRKEDLDPVVKQQNPHLNQLREVVAKPAAVSALHARRSLSAAHLIALGDEKRFEDSLFSAAEDLKTASGVMKTGFNKKRTSVVETIDEIASIAADMHERAHAR